MASYPASTPSRGDSAAGYKLASLFLGLIVVVMGFFGLWRALSAQHASDDARSAADRAAHAAPAMSSMPGMSTASAGRATASFAGLARSWTRLRIPEQRYAVFTHRDHVSTIRRTHNTIWTTWLPNSGYEVADAPHFERYGDDFDGQTGLGGIEVWLPLVR